MKLSSLIIAAALAAPLSPAAGINYSYDSAGRLRAVDYGGGTNTTYSFDAAGNLLSRATFTSANPDLALSQTASPSPATAGGMLHYTLSVINPSAASATGVVLTNVLPAGVTFLSASASQGTVAQAGGIVTCTFGTLTNGAGAALNILVRPGAPGTLLNSASVIASQPDPNPANNSSTLATTVLPPPSLAVALQGTALTFSWPLDSEGFILQETGVLLPPINWTPVAQPPPSIVGGAFMLPLGVNGASQFFRLTAP